MSVKILRKSFQNILNLLENKNSSFNNEKQIDLINE